MSGPDLAQLHFAVWIGSKHLSKASKTFRCQVNSQHSADPRGHGYMYSYTGDLGAASTDICAHLNHLHQSSILSTDPENPICPRGRTLSMNTSSSTTMHMSSIHTPLNRDVDSPTLHVECAQSTQPVRRFLDRAFPATPSLMKTTALCI